MRTKELEVQYNMARYEAEKKRAEAEVGRSRQLNAQIQTFSKTEGELRTQLNVYVDKFKQVSGPAPVKIPPVVCLGVLGSNIVSRLRTRSTIAMTFS